MNLVRKYARFTAIFLVVCVAISLVVTESVSANTNIRRTIRAGLNWGDTAVSTTNLQNNPGSGFEWGTYNSSTDHFTSFGSTYVGNVNVAVGGESQVVINRADTGEVLFTFTQNGTAELFGVRPLGANPSTRYRNSSPRFSANRNYTFFGGFRFERRGSSLIVVNIVDIEDYVKGVVPYEMSPSWHIEALRAQAITARSFAMFRMLNPTPKAVNNRFDLCVEACCQVYWGNRNATARTDQAITSTANLIVTHNGSIAETLYSSSHGGGSENNENVFLGPPRPYLRGVIDTYEEDVNIPNYNWTVTVSQSTLTSRVRLTHSNAGTIHWVQPEFTPTGNVRSVLVYDNNSREFRFTGRAALQRLFGGSTVMRSQRFTIDNAGTDGWVDVRGSNVVLRGRGWGHSIGLSQWGAQSMASVRGRTADQIIHHFYTGVQITNFETGLITILPSIPPISDAEQPGQSESPQFPGRSGWVQEGGNWFFVRSGGTVATGWLQDGGVWYYFNEGGIMQTGWINNTGSWYYLRSSGAMATGWVLTGGQWFFLHSSGAMATGWIFDGRNWYYLRSNGAMAVGWVETGGQWYFMRPSGEMVTGRFTADGVRHRFANDGRWLGRA